MFALEVLYSKFMVLMSRLVIRFYPQGQPVVFVGAGAAQRMTRSIASMGHRKLLVVTDRVLVELGLTAVVTDALTEGGVEWAIYDGVLPDPNIDQVDEGAAVLREEGCDAVLAIGGGSAIDAAKVIALQAEQPRRLKDIAGFFRVRSGGVPVYVVPTTAGTGSEATMVSVITDATAQQKVFIADPVITPRMAALDAELMRGMPPQITAATGMDALTHALESLLSKLSTEETRHYAGTAARLIFKNLAVAYAEPDNLDAREAMALGSYYAAAAFTKSNVGYVHGIAHQIGALYHVPHGVANAMLLPHVLEFYAERVPAEVAEVAAIAGIGDGVDDDAQRAQALVDAVTELVVGVGIPRYLDKLNEADFDAIVKRVRDESHGVFGYPVPAYKRDSDIRAILTKLLPAS